MKVRATLTFSDWTAMGGGWGRSGACRLFEQIRIAGITDLYWRVFNGGLAMYPSKVAEVQGRQVYESVQANNEYPFSTRPMHYLRDIDFQSYDAVADAAELAEEFGINLHLWYTIYEDAHGTAVQSQYNIDNPQYWHMDRDGRSYAGTFDWFYPEIRDQKLAIVDELVAYPAKGIMLDFVRHNATSSGDAAGIHRFGYNTEIRAAFKEAHGTDPMDLRADDATWLAFKTEIQTSLVREIRERMDASATCKELSLMLWPVNSLPWTCLDVPTLTQEGLVQLLSGFSITYSRSPDEARHQWDVLNQQCKSSDTILMPGLNAYWGITNEQVDVFAEAADDVGAPGIFLHEADSLTRYNITSSIRAINTERPRYTRGLKALRVEDGIETSDIPWDSAPVYDDFLYHYGKSPTEEPSEKTSVQFVYTNEALIVRFECEDHDMAAALAPVEPNSQSQYYIDVLRHRSPYFELNTFNVIVDPTHRKLDFYQFGVTPKGELISAMYIDENWSAPWSGEVTTEENKWIGLVVIPFTSVDSSAPQPGDTWGINLIRGIRSKAEINMWVPLTDPQTCPYDLVHLEFME
jgi:hypothetical protein